MEKVKGGRVKDLKSARGWMRAREIIRAVLESDLLHYVCEALLSFALWIVTSKPLSFGNRNFLLGSPHIVFRPEGRTVIEVLKGGNMFLYKCDRCGELLRDKVFKLRIQRLDRTGDKSTFTSRDGIELDLCEACYRCLKDWSIDEGYLPRWWRGSEDF